MLKFFIIQDKKLSIYLTITQKLHLQPFIKEKQDETEQKAAGF